MGRIQWILVTRGLPSPSFCDPDGPTRRFGEPRPTDLVSGIGIAILAPMALRDSPARPALGEARLAASGDATLEYRVSGPADGEVILLVPSFARSAADFNELVESLTTGGYRSLAIQPRGIEGSSLPPGDFTYHTFANDLVRVLDAEGIEGAVHVLGHAYGNRIARTFASDHPERTRSVILLAAGGAEATPPEMAEAITTAMLGTAPEEERRQATARAFFAEGNPVDEDWLRGWYPLAGFAQQAATPRSPFEAWGHGGTAPILVLQPGDDAVAASGGRLLKDAHPERVSLVVVEGAGHALLPEQPDFIASEVLRFLGGRR